MSPVLHLCVVIFVSSFLLYVIYIWKYSSAHNTLVGVSGVAHFITTDEQL